MDKKNYIERNGLGRRDYDGTLCGIHHEDINMIKEKLDKKISNTLFFILLTIFIGIVGAIQTYSIIHSEKAATEITRKLDGVQLDLNSLKVDMGKIETKLEMSDKIDRYDENKPYPYRRGD